MPPAMAAAQDYAQLKQQQAILTQQIQLTDQRRAQVANTLNAAQKTLDALKGDHIAAQEALNALTAPAKEAVAEREKLQVQLKEAKQNLEAIGDAVESQQSADSPLAKAKLDYQQKRDKYRKLVDQIKSSAEFQRKLKELQTQDSPSARLASLQDHFLKQNPAVQEALAQQIASSKKYSELRQKVLEDEPSWQGGKEDFERAKEEHATVERAAQDAARQRAAAVTKEREARKKLKSQSAGVATAQASIKQLEAARANLQRQLDTVNWHLQGR
jgi:chromosome segregation ATPase